MFIRSMQENLLIVLAKLLFKRKHCLALAYVTTLFHCYRKQQDVRSMVDESI